ncbi:MAG: circularly permuted type 2 ATP-grasp protein [Comamonas sp.]
MKTSPPQPLIVVANEPATDLLAQPAHELAASLAPAVKPGHFDELRGCCPATPARPLPEPSPRAPLVAVNAAMPWAGADSAAEPAALQPEAGDAAALAQPWQDFFTHLGTEGLGELDRKAQVQRRKIRDSGVTYNVYAESSEAGSRPWSLELFPLIVTPSSWAQIELGVRQRARLLNRIMADVYGPQQLTRSGMLPAALIQGHPDYLRPLHGTQPPGGNWLHVLAFDLARGPDGQWWVVSQRTQAPSGLGYLMENRLTTSALFPEAFRDMHVQRLAGTYRALLDNIRRLSPAGGDAHIALLTPGPYNETYFEQAYLARYLGLTLVEGHDLTVRGDQLFLKTLQGLKPVHGLIKRVDDNFVDPLELRADSTLGVPGLLQVVRAGNVVMANMPGSGFLESSALLGFMPALSEQLLGQTLVLPALHTWWCGERAVLDEALQQLSTGAIKSTYPGHNGVHTAVLGRSLSQSQRDEWAGRILRRSEDYTIQDYLPLSQMPTWDSGRIVPRSLMLRVFAVADGQDADGQPHWRVLPGGMVRLAPQGTEIASMQKGGSSADAWIITDGRVDQTTLLRTEPIERRHEKHRRLVTSRAAENLFWLGRYTERVENTTGLARLALHQLNSDDELTPALCDWLTAMCVRHGLVLPDVPDAASAPRVFERSLIAGLADGRHLTGIGHNLGALKRAGFAVRERLATEYWNLIVRTEARFARHALDQAGPARPVFSVAEALDLLQETSEAVVAMTGAQIDRMVRDEGWRLLSVGRQLERLNFHAQALETALELGTLDDDVGFSAVLTLFDSIISFNARYQHRRDLAALLDLLVVDRDNPRSLSWVADTLRGRVEKLAMSDPPRGSNEIGRRLAALLPEPSDWPLELLCTPDGDGRHGILQRHLQSCTEATWLLSDRIVARFFTHSDQLLRSVGM